MVRRYRPTDTPITPAITDPVLLRQMREQEVNTYIQCECGCSIDARHIDRHRRSKRHANELNWYRTQLLIAVAQAAQAAQASA